MPLWVRQLLWIPWGATDSEDIYHSSSLNELMSFWKLCLMQFWSIYFFFVQSAVVIEKEEKARNTKLKPKKRKLRPEGKHTHEYFCFCCGEGGELVMCDRKDCPKAYHLLCLNLTKPPYGNELKCIF